MSDQLVAETATWQQTTRNRRTSMLATGFQPAIRAWHPGLTCVYIAYTLRIHCVYKKYKLCIHYVYSVIHCVYTTYTLCIHSVYVVYIQLVHCVQYVYTVYTLHSQCMLYPLTPVTHIILFPQPKLSLCCRLLTWSMAMQRTSCNSPQTFHLNCLSCPSAMFPEYWLSHSKRTVSTATMCPCFLL